MFKRSRNIIAFSDVFLVLDALAVLIMIFSDLAKSKYNAVIRLL